MNDQSIINLIEITLEEKMTIRNNELMVTIKMIERLMNYEIIKI